MTLAWSMDKIGPIARSVEDCALVFAALHGSDGFDPTAVDRPFSWPAPRDLKSLRVGYFENELEISDRPELQVLKQLGVKLVPISLPEEYPVSAMTIILNTEAAAVFDELTRNHSDDQLGRWPNALRQGQFVPAVEYLRANRIRTLLMRRMEQVMRQVDAYLGGDDLSLTNLTGHPTVVLPGPLEEVNGVSRPSSLTFTGRLFGESELLSLAHAYQQETGDHLARPDLKSLLESKPSAAEETRD
jgi:Asp-tRNA(Asn)/Glu-tRNA(Gln) amidotransferase A subunit family amidase